MNMERLTYYDLHNKYAIRIIYDDDINIFYCDLPKKKRCKIFKINKNDFIKLIEDMEFLKIEDPYNSIERSITFEYVSIRTKEITEERYSIAIYIWSEHKEQILSWKNRGRFYDEKAKEFNISSTTLRNIISDFLKGGMTKTSLIPGYGNSGNKGQTKNYTVKPGPKNSRSTIPSSRLTKIFNKVVKKYLMTTQKKSIKEVYTRMIIEYFTDKLGEITSDKPSYDQFRNWINTNVDPEALHIARYSERVNEQKIRILTRTDDAEIFGPMEIIEIDSTPADIMLVSRENPSIVIGRPVLQLAIDVYSRLIVGIYVGLENDSYDVAIKVFENMLEDKVEYCRRYGIEIEKEQWPVSAMLPQCIVADRGPYFNMAAQRLQESFQIEVINKPPYRGDLKPIVERQFRSFNEFLKTNFKGAIWKDYRIRGEPDYKKLAVLNLDEVTKAILCFVIYHNSTSINHFITSKDQLSTLGEKVTPLDLWNYGIRTNRERYRLYNEAPQEFIKSILPIKKNVSMVRGRINIGKLTYVPKSEEDREWAKKVCFGGSYKVNYFYDHSRPYMIYVVDDTNPSYMRIFILVEKQKGFENMTMDEIRAHIAANEFLKDPDQDLKARATLLKAADEIASEADKRRKDLKIKKNVTKGIKQSRENEIKTQIEKDFYENSLEEKSILKTSQEDDEYNFDIFDEFDE